MQITTINTNSLAHHLRVAADQYDRDAATAAASNLDGLKRTFEDQAKQAREWAEAVENVARLGFEGDDLEIWHEGQA